MGINSNCLCNIKYTTFRECKPTLVDESRTFKPRIRANIALRQGQKFKPKTNNL